MKKLFYVFGLALINFVACKKENDLRIYEGTWKAHEVGYLHSWYFSDDTAQNDTILKPIDTTYFINVYAYEDHLSFRLAYYGLNNVI